MKARLKVGIAIAMVSLMSILAGCGGGGDDSATGDASTSGSNTDLSGTVKVWDLNYKIFPAYTKAIDQIDAEFEKANPDVTVERIYQPEEGYLSLVRTALVSGEVPDVLGEYPGYNGVLSFQNSLEVLNDRISPELEEVTTQWSSATPGLVEEGDHYGVPNGLNGFVYYYNKKLFKKAGLPTDFQPDSWQELREAGEQLKEAGIPPFADGNKTGNLFTQFYGAGLETENSQQEVSELAEGTRPYSDPSFEKTFDPLLELYNAGLYPHAFTSEFLEGFTNFEEEEGAIVGGLWSLVGSYLQFAPKLGEENVGIFHSPGASGFAAFGSSIRTIPIAAKNKDAAWALIEFESSKKSVETLFNVGEVLPGRKDVPLPADELIQGQELVDAAHNGEAEVFGLLAMKAPAEAPLIAGGEELLRGNATVADVLEGMQEAVEKEPNG